MESFTVHIQHQLHDIFGDLEPRVNIDLTREKLETLFSELDIRDEGVRERAKEQLTDILQAYQQALNRSYEQTKQNLFKLTSQLEYPSRQ
jgi:hypothetical protein